ncbi:MAG: hypothetical protein ABI867_13310 [Kofleriaceae bacterium]
MDPGALLYVEKSGERSSLEDVIADGLEVDYSDRFPALVQLMREGAPEHRLQACRMLAAWGVKEGLETMIAWARAPESSPADVTHDRLQGADDAFATLADSLRVARDSERPGAAELRVEATRALLAIYHRVFFGRALYAVLDMDRELAAAVHENIAVAIERAAAAHVRGFDMPTQAASLLGVLAKLDDAHTAQLADLVLAEKPGTRTVREVAYVLRSGGGPATRAILERLAAGTGAVADDAADSLTRRPDRLTN